MVSQFGEQLVMQSQLVRPCGFVETGDGVELQAQHFAQLAELGAELILFGSGAKIRFPQPHWLQALYARQIGVETMDTQAACRTFNFLSGEGRKVVAALLL